MKKVIFILLAVVCTAISANAKERFSVTVTTQINYVYYDENGTEVGRDSTSGASQSFTICADTPDQARSQAEQECATMCSRSYNKNEGKKSYKGKLYQCYSTREIYDSNVKRLNQSC